MDKVVQEGCSAAEHKAVTDRRLRPWFAVAYITRLRAYGLLLQPRPTASLHRQAGCSSVTPAPVHMAHYVQTDDVIAVAAESSHGHT